MIKGAADNLPEAAVTFDNFHAVKIANALIEGIDSQIQAAKPKARGYRPIRNLKAIVYLLAGKFYLQLPA